jgi:hypothetical protein
MTFCGSLFWHYFVTRWRVNGRSRLRCASSRKQLPLQPRTSVDQSGCQEAYLAGLALPLVLYEGDGNGGEWPKRYLRALETPQIACYVMFARARGECGMWFYLKPRCCCCKRLPALSFLKYIVNRVIIILDCLTLANGTDRLSRNVGTKLQFYAALNSKIAHLSFTLRQKLKWGTIIIRLPLVRWYGVE